MTLLKSILITALFISGWMEREGTARDPKITWTAVRLAFEEAPKHGLDPLELLVIAGKESRWLESAGCRSEGTGCGYYQQVPSVSQRWHDRCWDDSEFLCQGERWSEAPRITREELQDIGYATRVAARHYGWLRKRYGREEALRAYNRGIGRHSDGTLRRDDPIGYRYQEGVTRIYNALRQDVRQGILPFTDFPF